MVERFRPEDAVDRRLRGALEPPAGLAARVARNALGARAARGGHRRPVTVALTAAALALLVVVAALLLPVLRSGSPPEGDLAASRHSLSNRDGILVVRRPDGGATFLAPGARIAEPPRGMMLIVRKETRQ